MSDRGYAWVTGAGSGIGRAVALALGRQGYDVVASGRRIEPLNETVQAIHDNGGRAHTEPLDVTDPIAVDRLVARLASTGIIELAIVNAGTFTRAHAADLAAADWERQIDVNLSGAFHCLRAALRAMREQPLRDGTRGHVFTMNSGAGVRGFSAGPAYAAAKHGLRGLVESVRPDAAEHDIKLTDLVISAAVDSEMTIGRSVELLPADTVAHTVVSCLRLGGLANWDRVDLSQIRY